MTSYILCMISPSALRKDVMFCCCFNDYFSDFCRTSYLNIYRTDHHEICTIGRWLALGIFVKLFYRFFRGSCRGNQICLQIATLKFARHWLGRRAINRNILLMCPLVRLLHAVGRRQIYYLTRRTRTNRLTEQQPTTTI